MEEKLLEQEKRLRSELLGQKEIEVEEIQERLSFKEAKLRQYTQMIDELKKRLSMDLREHTNALGEMRMELEEANDSARENEANAYRYKVGRC